MTLKEAKELVGWVCAWAVIGIGCSFLIGEFTDIGRDDSDTATSRSNMAVRTDALTGCQYLESSKGMLAPCRSSIRRQVHACLAPYRLRHVEGTRPRKSLFHVEQNDSLHRHQSCQPVSIQSLTDAYLRHFRLNPTHSDCVKAQRGHAYV